jgi:MFS family permease
MAEPRSSRLIGPLRLLVTTAWVGTTWGIGYAAAPTLFSTLADRVLAGTIAGYLFRVEALVSLVAAVLMLALLWPKSAVDPLARRRSLQLVVVMLLCTLLGYYGLQPMMAELKAAAGPSGVMDSAMAQRFGMLHAISSVFYLVKSLAGGWLVVLLGRLGRLTK